MKRSSPTRARSCMPTPIGPASSRKATRKRSVRRLAAKSCTSAVTAMPTGVAATWFIPIRVPTVRQVPATQGRSASTQVHSPSESLRRRAAGPPSPPASSRLRSNLRHPGRRSRSGIGIAGHRRRIAAHVPRIRVGRSSPGRNGAHDRAAHARIDRTDPVAVRSSDRPSPLSELSEKSPEACRPRHPGDRREAEPISKQSPGWPARRGPTRVVSGTGRP